MYRALRALTRVFGQNCQAVPANTFTRVSSFTAKVQRGSHYCSLLILAKEQIKTTASECKQTHHRYTTLLLTMSEELAKLLVKEKEDPLDDLITYLKKNPDAVMKRNEMTGRATIMMLSMT